MKFFFDNDISHRLARMLAALGCDVVALRDELDASAADIDVFEHLRGKDIVLVTADRKIRGRPAEIAALRAAGITALFLGPFFSDKVTLWKQAEWFVRHWKTVEGFANGTRRGTIAIVQQNGQSVPQHS